jgi:hypothetical protein
VTESLLVGGRLELSAGDGLGCAAIVPDPPVLDEHDGIPSEQSIEALCRWRKRTTP